jgi:hypothetical protein
MKLQRLDPDASPLLQDTTYPNADSQSTSGIPIAEAVQRLCEKFRQRFPRQPSHIEHRLNWFIGLYLASLLSFIGLISTVRWTLELL